MKTLYNKAVKHLEFGELDEAEDALNTYLKENPTDAMAHNKMGVVFVRRPNSSTVTGISYVRLRQQNA